MKTFTNFPEILKTLVDKKASINNTIDLDAYANGALDCYDVLNKPITYTEEEVYKTILLFSDTYPKLFFEKMRLYEGIPNRDDVVKEWFNNNKKK